MNFLRLISLFLFLTFSVNAAEKKTTIYLSDPKHYFVNDKERFNMFDPHKVFEQEFQRLITATFETLVEIDSSNKIKPLLAKSWKYLNPVTLEFVLMDNVTFSNGEKLTADTVKFSFDRLLDPKTKYPGAPFFRSIKEVKVAGAKKIHFILNHPDAFFLHSIALFGNIIPVKYFTEVGEKQFGEKPVGTGPFVVDHYDENTIYYLKNKTYWKKGFPKLDKMELKYLQREDAIKELFEGKLDFYPDIKPFYNLEVAKNPKLNLIKGVTQRVFTITFNRLKKDSPLQDVNVRKAMNMAINKDEMIQYIMYGNGHKTATYTCKGQIGHNPKLVPYEYDIEKAKLLLKKAGYENGFKLDGFYDIDDDIDAAKFIKNSLKKINIDLSITHDHAQLIIDANMSKGIPKYDIFISQLPDVLGTGTFAVQMNFFSEAPFSMVRDQKLDQLFIKSVTEVNPQAQKASLMELDKYVYDNAFALFTLRKISSYAINKKIKGFVPKMSDMDYGFKLLDM